MVDITEISAVVAAVGVLIGVVYYVMDLRHQAKIRKTDLLMRLWTLGNTDEMWDALKKVTKIQVKDYEDYVAKYGSMMLSDDPVNKALQKVYGFYAMLGNLAYKKLIDIDSLYHFTGSDYPRMLYEKLKPITMGLRRDLSEPFLMSDFEYLCSELTRIEPQIMDEFKKREQKIQGGVNIG